MDLSLDFFLRLGAGHFETVYHISPEANIQRFRGTYSLKFGERGIFVGPKMAVFRSWAPYVAGKKGEGQRYKNLTLYTLKIPKVIYSEARRQYDEAYQKAYQRALGHFKGDEMMAHLALYSSFGWDKEIFISKDFLDRVQIAGRRTFPTGALTSEGRQRKPDTDLSPLEAARRVSNTNPAAKLYLDLLVRLNRINLSKSEKDRYEVKETRQYLQNNLLPSMFYDVWDKVLIPDLTSKDKIRFNIIVHEIGKIRRKIETWEVPKYTTPLTPQNLLERYRERMRERMRER